MEALALVLVTLGLLGLRQVSRGRAVDVGADVNDALASLARGDFDGVAEVVNREPADAFSGAALTASPGTGQFDGVRTGSLLAECQKLGAQANNRYVLGATGPSAYDCSGIVWRAMKNLNMYSGPRFTTATFEIQCSEFITRVDTPAVNDVVLWRSGHMGVYSGNGQVYAAKSSRSGIGFQSATDPIRGSRPIYYRWTVPASQRRNTAVDRRLS